MMNGACLLAMWQAYVLVASCQVTGFDQSAGVPCHIAEWQCFYWDHTVEEQFWFLLPVTLWDTLVIGGQGDLLCDSLILSEEEVWPMSAEKVSVLTLLAVCGGGLQKIVRGGHLFSLDEETVRWVFPLFNTVNC